MPAGSVDSLGRPGGLKLYGAFVGANRTTGKIYTGAIVGAAVGGWIRFNAICAGYIEDHFVSFTVFNPAFDDLGSLQRALFGSRAAHTKKVGVFG